jgi:hypothetical protein
MINKEKEDQGKVLYVFTLVVTVGETLKQNAFDSRILIVYIIVQ